MESFGRLLLGTGLMAFFTYFLLYFLICGAASDNMYLLSKYNFANSASLIAFLITLLVQILIGPLQCCPHSDGLHTDAVLFLSKRWHPRNIQNQLILTLDLSQILNALLLGMLRLKGWCRLMPLQDLGAMAKQRNELLVTG